MPLDRLARPLEELARRVDQMSPSEQFQLAAFLADRAPEIAIVVAQKAIDSLTLVQLRTKTRNA